jgi:hypothetical protein
VICLTEANGFGRKVHTRQLLGVVVPLDEGRAATPATSNFQHFTALQRDRPGNTVVKLDGVPIHLIVRFQDKRLLAVFQRRVSIVHEPPISQPIAG